MNGVPDHPELLLRERAWLHALARQLVQPHEGAEELAHDALTAAMTQPKPRADGERGGLRGWLAAILRKQLAGRRRAEHRRRAREAMAARAEALPATLDTVARFEVQRGVADAVLALSEPYRTTVLMRFWEGLSPAAIAARMGVPVETVRTRLKRGLALLRERLDRAHGGDRLAWMVPLAGMTFMTTSSKVVLAGIAVAAAAWLLMASPWSPIRDVEVPAAGPGADAVAAVLAPPAADPVAPAAATPELAAQRAAVVAPGEAPWLTVTGTVVDDATDMPLRDVPVRLAAWPDRGAVEVRTAEDGTFTLADVRPSRFEARQVVVLGADYAVARTEVVYDFRSEAPQSFEAGTVRLVRGTKFSGQVVDPEARAVPEAELLLPLLSIGYGGIGGPQHMLQRWASLGHADAGGSFQLAQPIAPERNHENLLFAIAGRGVGWCRFEAGKQRRESPGLVIRLRPTGAVRVVIEDPRGQAVAGVLVRALPRFSPLGFTRREFRQEVGGPDKLRAWFAGRTDARGELLLGQLPVGERDLHNVGRTEDDYDLLVEADGFPAQPLAPFDLLPGVEQRVAVRLVAAREVTVLVAVRDDLGAPIAGAAVQLGGSRTEQGTTDAAGQVELAVAFAPKLAAVASCAGHLQASAQLEPGPDTTHMQTSLVLARAVPLDGRVVDQTGAAVAGMNVFVEQRHLGSTDAEGRFHVEQFPMGSRRLIVALGSGMDACRWTGGQEPQHVDAAQGPVTIVMQRRPGAVDVRVAIVDAATGEPLEPVEASLCLHHLESDLFFFPKRTQTGLGLVMSQGTPAGRWQLAVRTGSGQRGSVEFTLTDGQAPVDLRLELPAPGTITGRLVFTGVAPPATVTIGVRHATVERRAFVQFRYPGRWYVDASSQAVVDDTFGGTGSLRLQPAQNASFRLDSADPTDDLVFTVRGEGIAGQATLRVGPGASRELVVEVTAKGR